MQLGWQTHFFEIVLPAWRSYLAAEARLTQALIKQDDVERARFDALREAGASALYVHHYADIVAAERPYFVPRGVNGIGQVREWLGEACRMLRTGNPSNDVALLGDVADALKHSHLTRRLEEREVAAREAVVVIGAAFGELGFGEGKFGGQEQVLVLANRGTRAMSSILQNVIDAWCRHATWKLSDPNAA